VHTAQRAVADELRGNRLRMGRDQWEEQGLWRVREGERFPAELRAAMDNPANDVARNNEVWQRFVAPTFGPRVQAWQLNPRPGASSHRVLTADNPEWFAPPSLLRNLRDLMRHNDLHSTLGPFPRSGPQRLLGMDEEQWYKDPGRFGDAADYLNDTLHRAQHAKERWGLRSETTGDSLVGTLNSFFNSRARNDALQHAGVDAIWYDGGVRRGNQRHNALNVINPKIAQAAPGFAPSGVGAQRAAAAVARRDEMLRPLIEKARANGAAAAQTVEGQYTAMELGDLALGSSLHLGYPKGSPQQRAFIAAFMGNLPPHVRYHS